ncbi:VWA domain-containing protein [Vibrio sinensis]|uniref:VWA domain-containing protein n=1 Tax=Vibrio sinensis TaxID=2302434 RepID=A0A3A6QQZ6_9VIBR|nr:VWA domain-containing protein [Vibrio sinensis]RJX75350.1 VWA domain-containing protein [Vibrio sinensis]
MSEFMFLKPLWLLAIVPLSLMLLWLQRRTHHQTLIAPHLAKIMGMQQKKSSNMRLALIGVCATIAIVALAGPSFEKSERPAFSEASARVVVMDMSLSMYATDLSPNRLTQAKYKVTDLLKGWKEGETGMVAYAGDAYTISPMTSDTNTILNLLPSLSPEIMPYPGANAAKGVELAVKMMQNTGLASGNIILISDDIDQQEMDDIEQALAGTSWHLDILGVGTRAGAPIQLNDGSLLKTANGQTVVAKANFNNMETLAKKVDGFFTPIQINNSDVAALLAQTQSEQKTTKGTSKQTLSEPVNNGYWLVLLLIIPALLMFRKGILFSLFFATLPVLHSPDAQANPWLTDDQQAYENFQAKKFSEASAQFKNPEWKGIAQYQNGQFEQAISSLSGIETASGKYNLANAYAQAGELEKAVELYKQSLSMNPNNTDAQTNLDLVNEALKQQQQQQKPAAKQNSQQSNSDSQKNDSDSNDKNADNKQQGSGGEQNQQNSSKSQSQQQAQDGESKGSTSQDESSPPSPQQSQTDQDKNGEVKRGEEQQNNEQQTQADLDKQVSKDSKPQDSHTQSGQEESGQTESVQAKSSQQKQRDDKTEKGINGHEQADNQQTIDPQLRKLEQVESARDPSRLLRAQLVLQAQQKQAPENNGKQW